MKPILKLSGLKKHFPIKQGLFSKTAGFVHAVDGVDLIVNQGETCSLVGESGCGKTTVAKTLMRLHPATAGQAIYDGLDIFNLHRGELKELWKRMQIIFQDPYSSLNPRMTVEKIISQSLKNFHQIPKSQMRDAAAEIITKVGLRPEHLKRYPHEFSGGQRQRIGIARALIGRIVTDHPKLIVCDEPVSALDVSIQAQIINLLKQLQREFGLTILFISHDLSVVEHISSQVAVMYLGKIVESGEKNELFTKAAHPYTKALLSAIPKPEPPEPGAKVQNFILKGDVPSPINPPSGCYFHPRCPERFDLCEKQFPELKSVNNNHMVACHLLH